MSAKEFRLKKGAIVYSKGNNSTILDIQGISGQMFSVVDNLEGLIHHVSDASGTPIFEVYSDNILKLGLFASPAIVIRGSNLHQSTTNTTITTATTLSLNMSTSNNITRYLLQANLTINFATDPSISESTTHTFIFKQDGTGGKTVTWNTTGTVVKWQGGIPPLIADGVNEVTIITIIWDGFDYYGIKSCGFNV